MQSNILQYKYSTTVQFSTIEIKTAIQLRKARSICVISTAKWLQTLCSCWHGNGTKL